MLYRYCFWGEYAPMTEMMNKGQTCRHYWPPASELCINVDIVNQNIRYRSDMILCSALIGVPGSCSFDPLIILITASSDVIRLLEFKDRECFPPPLRCPRTWLRRCPPCLRRWSCARCPHRCGRGCWCGCGSWGTASWGQHWLVALATALASTWRGCSSCWAPRRTRRGPRPRTRGCSGISGIQ